MTVRLVSLFSLALAASSPAVAEDWGCYDPQPGHPTSAEKSEFVSLVSALAVTAEHRHGVPASAIAAMAMVESGYGWTRTAKQANNFFGWKYNSSSAAGGRKSFSLACQPPADVNNRYVVFASAADAVNFVAEKLATLGYYRQDAEAYRLARAAGQPVDTAVKAWVVGISDPYNWRPAEYAKTLTRVMNDPISPSDQVSPRNLYRLSEDGAPTLPAPVPASAPDAQDEQLLATTRAWFAARIGSRSCEAPVTTFPRWDGFPVQLCSYVDSGIQVKTYMLNPSPDQLAKWTVTACSDAGTLDRRACAVSVSKAIMEASSAVFPVAGFIPEPASSGGGQGNAMQCFLFRDGVTVTTMSTPSAPAAVNATCPAPDNEGAVVKARRFARVASTTRAEYLAAGGVDPVGTDADGDPRWLDVVRALYQQAWNSDRNVLISAKAKSLKAAHRFP
ncbi:glucosaminidase domain-containing protein [Roseateles sp.]|uniref:glucosaminidase domain-containing protein n=1 Tax=Roseateles sp. TaxID=1971397 RepID=UPI003264C2FD